jgi:hypothetical protein
MSNEELRFQINQNLNNLENTELEVFCEVLINYLNKNQFAEDWDNLSKKEQIGLENAVEEMDLGYGKSHDNVMKRFITKYA